MLGGRLRSGIVMLVFLGLFAEKPVLAQRVPNPPPVVTPTPPVVTPTPPVVVPTPVTTPTPTPTPTRRVRRPTGAGFVNGNLGGDRRGLAIGIGVGAAAIGLGLAAGALRSQPAFGVPSDATIMEARPRQQEPEEPLLPPETKTPRIRRVAHTPSRTDERTAIRQMPTLKQPPIAQAAPTRPGFVVPVASEKRFVPNEVLVVLRGEVPTEKLRLLEKSLGLTALASTRIALIDAEVRRYKLPRGASVAATVRALRGRSFIAGAQPNYLFELQQDKAKPPATSPAVQYAVDALRLTQAHKLANGSDVRIAVIDSGIDETNPELKDAVADRFDAVGGAFAPHTHGTAIGGAIVAHKSLTGTAPKAKLIAVRAFTGAKPGTRAGANGTGFDVLRGLDYAVAHGARIVNMSFAGPQDALLKAALDAARKRGVVIIAAVGNAGPMAKPLFPAAEPGVIAVTATDADGKPFAKANRGPYVAVAAPGVNIVAPGLGDTVQITSGTSIATAEASGVAALLLERRPRATPDDIRKILGDTAVRLRTEPAAGGAGLIDAEKAVQATK